MGVPRRKYEVGKFAESKEIHEAIALIPYVDEPIRIIAHGWTGFKAGPAEPKHSIYSTREIVPGKHFLPIQSMLFENILSFHIMDKTMTQQEIIDSNLLGSTGDSFSEQLATDNATTQDETGKLFWLLNARQEAINTTDVGRMINQLSSFNEDHGGFVLPPEFDFMHNRAVPPFQIIVSPFSHTLEKQELIDIYQGILPDSGLESQKVRNSEEVSVHPNFIPQYGQLYIPRLMNQQIQGVANFASPDILNHIQNVNIEKFIDKDASLIPYKTAREFYKNLRFMVFRIKQRAKKDYKNYRLSEIAKSVEETRIEKPAKQTFEEGSEFRHARKNRTKGDIFGANWPYDYFSLIETAKIDIEFEVPG